MIESGDCDYGLWSPASYISKSTLTFFGGYSQYSSSIQQSLDLDDIMPTTRVNIDDSDFQDLLYRGGIPHGNSIECFKSYLQNHS